VCDVVIIIQLHDRFLLSGVHGVRLFLVVLF
jgi:hypothetical protein